MQQAAYHSEPSPSAQPIKTVMVVDDSRLQRRILSSMLTRWGYQVIEADTGSAALELCQSAMPDMVFSDWMMPEMTELEFCKALRKRYPDTYSYFILLTSKAEKTTLPKDWKVAQTISRPSRSTHPNYAHASAQAGGFCRCNANCKTAMT